MAIEEASIQCSVKDSSATLTCRYKGSPQPKITWMADSQPISEDNPHQIHSEGENHYRHILFINSTLTTTKYICRVSNSFESANSTVNTHLCRNNGTSSTSSISSSTTISSLPISAFYLCIISLITSSYSTWLVICPYQLLHHYGTLIQGRGLATSWLASQRQPHYILSHRNRLVYSQNQLSWNRVVIKWCCLSFSHNTCWLTLVCPRPPHVAVV